MISRALRSDALPEGWILRGLRAPCGHLAPCGCHHWPGCCEKCPFPKGCRFTGVSGGQTRSFAQAPRNAAIISAQRSGATITEVCDRFQLSRRRVFRILAAAKKGAP